MWSLDWQHHHFLETFLKCELLGPPQTYWLGIQLGLNSLCFTKFSTWFWCMPTFETSNGIAECFPGRSTEDWLSLKNKQTYKKKTPIDLSMCIIILQIVILKLKVHKWSNMIIIEYWIGPNYPRYVRLLIFKQLLKINFFVRVYYFFLAFKKEELRK